MEEKDLQLALKTHGDEIKAKQAELRTAIDTQKAELKAEIEALEAKRKEMQTQLDTIATDQAKAAKEGQKSDENMTLGQAVKELMNSDKFKAAKAAKFSKDNVFEIKAATTDITGVVNLTQQRLQVGFIPDRAMAFLPYTNTGVIGAEKSRVLWVEGAYTSNVGYVAQGTGSATADTGVTVEKSRGMAKISAKLPLTAELLEDADYIASAFRMKMQSRAMLFADGEFYTGSALIDKSISSAILESDLVEMSRISISDFSIFSPILLFVIKCPKWSGISTSSPAKLPFQFLNNLYFII